jgi:hypothetical protein
LDVGEEGLSSNERVFCGVGEVSLGKRALLEIVLIRGIMRRVDRMLLHITEKGSIHYDI